MNVKEFIETTLKQIIDGVHAAQLYGSTCGATVNPGNVNSKGQELVLDDPATGALIQQVEFDVALSVIEGKETKAGVGVLAAAVGFGAQGKTEQESSAVSRIKFSVPVALPVQGPLADRAPKSI
jgi:hypothetical protein